LATVLFACFLVADLLLERREPSGKLGEPFLTFREELYKGLAGRGRQPVDRISQVAEFLLQHLQLVI
jgi:hypothetical protein